MTASTFAPEAADRFDRIWAGLSTADRVVLLGHDSDTLNAADKMRLARVVSALGKARRETGRPRRARRSRRR